MALRGPVSGTVCALACLLAGACAAADVALAPARALPGSTQTLSFRVLDGCPGGERLQMLRLALPWGLRDTSPLPLTGWTAHLVQPVHKNGPLGQAGSVMWRATGAAGVPVAPFLLRTRLPLSGAAQAFDVSLHCEGGGTVHATVALQVSAPAAAPVTASLAWLGLPARGSGDDAPLSLTLRSNQDLRLVAASSPAARRIELRHTWRSRLQRLDLSPPPHLAVPAGTTVPLTPAGVHLSVQGLDASWVEGRQMPLTLRFEDNDGVMSELQLQVPVRAQAPASAGDAQRPAP